MSKTPSPLQQLVEYVEGWSGDSTTIANYNTDDDCWTGCPNPVSWDTVTYPYPLQPEIDVLPFDNAIITPNGSPHITSSLLRQFTGASPILIVNIDIPPDCPEEKLALLNQEIHNIYKRLFHPSVALPCKKRSLIIDKARKKGEK